MEGFFDDIVGISTLGGGERNSISIGGLSSNLVLSTLDGQSFGEGRSNGGLSVGDIPTDMILRVNVHLTPEASMEEGGAGGRVNLQMRVPMDIPRASNRLNARLGYVPGKDDFSPSASFFMGRPSASRKFGYMLSVSLSDRAKQTDSQRISGWDLKDFDGTSAFAPGQVSNSADNTDQRSIFTGLVLGFRPQQSLQINGKLLLSQEQKDTENHSLQHRIEKQGDIFPLAFDERIVSELESSDDRRRNLRVIGNTRRDRFDSMILGADFKWRHEDWRAAGAVGYNTVTGKSDGLSQSIVFDANSAFGYAASDDGSLIMSYTDDFPSNEDFTASRISLSARNVKDSNRFGSVDMTRQLGKGIIRRVKFGAKIRDMTSSRRSPKGVVSPDESLILSEYASSQTHQTPWDTIEWPSTDMEAVDSVVEENPIDWRENLLSDYDIEQQTSGAYLQADFRAELTEARFLVGDIGVRIVGTESSISGFQDYGEGPEPFSLQTDYTDVLPSLSMRTRITERANLTIGAAKVMTRPTFNSLAPGNRLNYTDRTGKSGNPNLQPFRANQFFAALAWTPKRGSRLSGAISYRDVESYFALAEESVEINDDVFLITRPINGENGSILSISAKMNQDLRRLFSQMRNFSLSVSYTHNKSRTDLLDPYSSETLPMPNTAASVIKMDLAYSDETFSGKLRYSWRGESLKSPLSDSGLSVWNQPVGSLDLNLGWQLNENVRLRFDARNLLNEDQLQTTDFSGQLLRISERYKSLSATLLAKW
jgi:iron complex outermembrane receptor protein